MRFIAVLMMLCPVIAFSASSVLKASLWGKASQWAGVSSSQLYSIALQESGMVWRDQSFRPWPWTLTVNKGNIRVKPGSYRYASKADAANALTQMLSQGVTNIDVGLMQVNLYWHGHRVSDKQLLLEPSVNLMVAASILKEVNTLNDLTTVIGRYHSFNSRLGSAYANKVKRLHVMVSKRYE